MDALQFDLNITIVAIFSILVFSYLLFQKSKPSNHKPPPAAAGAWPIIGHLHLLGGTQPPHRTLAAMADKYGPIFTIKLGLHQALIVSSSEIAKECFTTHDMVVCSRPKLMAGEFLGYNYAMFSFAPHGTYWREMRKITTVELLSNRRLELLKHVKISEVKKLMKKIHKIWIAKRNGSGQISVNMEKWFKKLTLNIILRMIVGKRYKFNDGQESPPWMELLSEFFYLSGAFVVSDSIPILRWIDLGGYEKAMKKTAKELDSILGEWAEEHRQRIDSGEDNCEADFIDVMLGVIGDKGLGGYDSDTIIKATSLNLIGGGSDTTMITLTWAIALLLNNKEALHKAKQELDIHIGNQKMVNESDINQLPYLQAIVKETMRLHPAVQLLPPREFSEDCRIGSYNVRKGTRLIVNLCKLQTNPQVWEEPLMFKPERFLSSHKDFDVRGKNFEFLPFGSGRRICPGITMALQTVHFVLASFLHGYDIETTSDKGVDMSESCGLTNGMATPLEVLVSPRLPSHVYA